MTALTLTKHHGLGNDFLVVFDPPEWLDLPSAAIAWCDRRTGVGADGLLVGTSQIGVTARMRLFNADGSTAEISGNGIRCFAQALAERQGSTDPQLIATDAGERMVHIVDVRGATIDAAVAMGAVGSLPEPEGWGSIGCDPRRPVAHLDLGNPHSVVGVDDVAAVDLVAIGTLVPQVNLEVIEAGPGRDEITMRVHERGAGITQACGTGACAAAWAAVRWGLVAATASEITVHMPGGAAKVQLHQPSHGEVTLVGPATKVATLTVDVPVDLEPT
jgi:diaminopimelate epimerase